MYNLVSAITALLLVFSPQRALPRADVLIVSPHPDDAVLCCGGLIRQKLRAGQSVIIVNMANGDDFRESAASVFGKSASRLQPADMIRYAGLRQREDVMALNALGVPRSNILYLAYPDGSLSDLYDATGSAIFHKAVNHYETYKALLKDYHSNFYGIPGSYTKQTALADITDIIRRTSPAEIYVSGPPDTAPDHLAAYRFVRDATTSLRYTGKLYTYVVHADRWPNPPYITQNDPFIIPGKWPEPLRVPLSSRDITRKLYALDFYTSQLRMRDFPYYGFVKNEEVFWK